MLIATTARRCGVHVDVACVASTERPTSVASRGGTHVLLLLFVDLTYAVLRAANLCDVDGSRGVVLVSVTTTRAAVALVDETGVARSDI